jgi:hypothetical protein
MSDSGWREVVSCHELERGGAEDGGAIEKVLQR